jgi:hypothetical protein
VEVSKKTSNGKTENSEGVKSFGVAIPSEQTKITERFEMYY